MLFSNKSVSGNNTKEIYDEELKSSGIIELWETLPKNVVNSLQTLGLTQGEPTNIKDIDINNFFDEITNISKKNFRHIFSPLISILGILMFCVAVKNFVPDNKKIPHENIINPVCSLCICGCVIAPITQLIASSKLVISGASNFTLGLGAVISGIMLVSGRTITASSYNYMVVLSGQIISKFSEGILIPLMNSLFGISVISSISTRIKLEKLCFTVYKSLKTIIKFMSTLFVGILTLQNIVASSADNLGTASAKMLIDTCIPIVGNAVSDAFTTIGGCLKLLKSGVGAFGIIAGLFIFIPIITECIIWIIFLNICEFLSDTFELVKPCLLFKSTAEIVKTLMAILICAAVIIISSSGIIMIIGG